jgi:sulfite exporter TauE/SafE
MQEAPLLTVLAIGFVLGARHALDTDHIIAVSTLLSRHPNLRASGLIGVSWGCGHTAVLLLVGFAVMIFNLTIPRPLAAVLEFAVGIMLVVLGASLAHTIWRDRWHLHSHQHDSRTHLHLHSHARQDDHAHRHRVGGYLRPFLVGMVHGLAGSAAPVLVILSAVRTPLEGIAYILVFGIGSILGMMVLGVLISLPILFSASISRPIQMALQGLISIGSIGVGVAIMVDVALQSPLN